MALNRQSRLTFLLALFLIYCDVTAAAAANAAAGTSQCGAATRPLDAAPSNSILVVGSVNVDIITEVDRLPRQDENIMARSPKMVIAVGGKGANQAVAAARSAAGTGTRAAFACRFGSDAHAPMLESTLRDNGVDLSASGHSPDYPSGQGLVFLQPDGSVSAVVVGGSNAAWRPEHAAALGAAVRGAAAVMLQREVPEFVNEAVAAAAAQAGVPVMQDVGGEDRPISDALLRQLAYVTPNESELRRLTGMPTDDDAAVEAAAASLQSRGARNVLVTLGERGALLLTEDGRKLRQAAIDDGPVIDATGAGDAFRAAFAVCTVEQRPAQDCLRFAAAAGGVAASRLGAVPSLPTRADILRLLPDWDPAPSADTSAGAAGSCAATSPQHDTFTATAQSAAAAGAAARSIRDASSLQFASRLNSMKERPELWAGAHDVLGLVARQGTVKGLGLVDFNYPQHLEGLSPDAVRSALSAAGLAAGAVCIRFPPELRLGAFSNPNATLRQAAVQLAAGGCRWARELGAKELVVWSAYDGYDYHLQIDYAEAWRRTVDSFRALSDACADLRVSLEWKPSDEHSRFSVVPSTGAALLLVKEVSRPNFGLTLDTGHLLMAGENVAQSIAMTAAQGALFGLQVSDAHSRLGAEDGLILGSVHPRMALEMAYWLQVFNYSGHVYFDTFPRNEDPVREAEYNIRTFKAAWTKASALAADGRLAGLLRKHEAMGVLELLEEQGL